MVGPHYRKKLKVRLLLNLVNFKVLYSAMIKVDITTAADHKFFYFPRRLNISRELSPASRLIIKTI